VNNPYLLKVAGYDVDLRKVVFVGPLFNADPEQPKNVVGIPKAYQVFTSAPAILGVNEREFSRRSFIEAWDNVIQMDEGLIVTED
jgi:hypothetical protein